jgi:nucleotide-binding universal stress UspA family protein/quercetin dioxygenase-like cupin family protein
MSSIRTILHPTDFSENSQYAFQAACSLAKDHQANLILLHVLPPLVAPIMPVSAPNPLVSADSQECLKRWQFAWPQPSDPSLRVEHRVAEGNAAREILHLAQALRCDVIVMGTHGRTGLDRFLTGSVAEEVLRQAVCPVLVVRMPPPAPEAEVVAPVKPSDIVDIRPLAAALAAARTKTLVKASDLDIVRLIVPAGTEIPEHRAKGALVLQCLEGRVLITALGKAQNLQAGELLYLPKGERHALKGIEPAALLLTIFRGQH